MCKEILGTDMRVAGNRFASEGELFHQRLCPEHMILGRRGLLLKSICMHGYWVWAWAHRRTWWFPYPPGWSWLDHDVMSNTGRCVKYRDVAICRNFLQPSLARVPVCNLCICNRESSLSLMICSMICPVWRCGKCFENDAVVVWHIKLTEIGKILFRLIDWLIFSFLLEFSWYEGLSRACRQSIGQGPLTLLGGLFSRLFIIIARFVAWPGWWRIRMCVRRRH